MNTPLVHYERVNVYECRMFSFLLLTQITTEEQIFPLVPRDDAEDVEDALDRCL